MRIDCLKSFRTEATLHEKKTFEIVQKNRKNGTNIKNKRVIYLLFAQSI